MKISIILSVRHGTSCFGSGVRCSMELHNERFVVVCGIAHMGTSKVKRSASEEKLMQARSKICSDLLARGFHVRAIPGGTEPEPSDFEGAELSVHLFAQELDSLNQAPDRHAVAALRAAMTYSRINPKFHVFVWTESGPNDAANLSAIDQLLRTEEWVGFSTEFVQTTLEDFKSLLYDRLGLSSGSHEFPGMGTRLPATGPPHTNAELYVIYDPMDAPSAAPVAKFLEAQGIRVLLPDCAADPNGAARSTAALRAIHNENLRRCDAALIIYGNVHEPWVRMKLQDLLRSPALGRTRNLTARGVYLCAGMSETKKRFSAPGIMILHGSPLLPPMDFASALGPFIQQLAVAK